MAASAGPNARSKHWSAPLSLAIKGSGLAVVDALLEGGGPERSRP